LLLMVVGAVGLWRYRQRAFLGLLLGPLLFNFVAAAGKFYPYGGSIRVSIFMAPAFCLLMGHGISLVVQRLKSSAQAVVGIGICTVLFSFAAIGLVRDIQQPFKSEGDVRAAEFAAWMAENVGAGSVIYGWCNQKDGSPDFHGLGGSMARLRVQLQQAGVDVDWMPSAAQQSFAITRSEGESFWILAYTDDNDTGMPFPEAEFQAALEKLALFGLEGE